MDQPTPAVLIPRPEDPQRAAGRYAGAFIAGFSSAETRRGYRRDLRQWFEFCRSWDLDPLSVQRAHIDIYARELDQTSYSNSTRARRISTLRSFFNWLVDQEVLDANPAARVRGPRQHRPPMPSLTKHELHRYLNAADDALETTTVPKPRARGRHANPRPLLTTQEHAGIMILALVALRVSEVCDLNVASVREQQHMHVIDVIGKGDKARTCAVPSRVMVSLDAAASDRGTQVGPLLLNKHRLRMQPAQLQAAVAVVAEHAGFGGRGLTPHALRRTWIEVALADGVPLPAVQKHVGHSNINTTMWYDRTELSPERSPVWAVQAAVA